MRRFLKHIALIVSVLIAGMYLLDYIYTLVYNNAKPRSKVAYILKEENSPVDYTFIGSSRVENYIDAATIEKETGRKAINLGVQAAIVDDYFLLFDLALKKGIIKDTVFIQLDYAYNVNGTSSILKSALMPYIHNPKIDSYIKERDPDYYKLKYIPFYRYLVYEYKIGFREIFLSTVRKKSNVDFSNGYIPRYGTSGEPMKGRLPNKLEATNTGVEAINALAKEHQITIIYFIAPLCNETLNLDFAEKLEQRIPGFKNYARLYENNNEFFYNCTHLNNKGAQQFSKQIAKDILEKNF